MRRINREFLNHDYLTDVICFNYRDEPGFEQDPEDPAVEIFISPDIAAERAEDNPEFAYESELLLYIVHGVLHAAGKRDKTPEEKKDMRNAENEIITRLYEENLTADRIFGGK